MILSLYHIQKKYRSEKALIWVYFTQCCSGVSFADFGQIVAARDVIFTIFGWWLLQILEKKKEK